MLGAHSSCHFKCTKQVIHVILTKKGLKKVMPVSPEWSRQAGDLIFAVAQTLSPDLTESRGNPNPQGSQGSPLETSCPDETPEQIKRLISKTCWWPVGFSQKKPTSQVPKFQSNPRKHCTSLFKENGWKEIQTSLLLSLSLTIQMLF